MNALETNHDVGAAGPAAARGAADWLCLAAAPTLAVMALLTCVQGGGAPDMLCLAAHDASPLSGMAAMYGLMSAFHLPPWLKLVSGRPSEAVPPKVPNDGTGRFPGPRPPFTIRS